MLQRVQQPGRPTATRSDERVVRAPRGTQRSAKSWLTEAPLRMLMNNLDPEVAENPHELVVYGGIGRAARNWECFDAIVDALRRLGDDESLLIQSGKPVGVFRTHPDAPRVLIANSNLVPRWATWEHFNELDRKGLMMFGQMTAGSWIYIGSQGIVQGTYETFAEAGRQHYGGDLADKWILTAGLGGMGGAQPLAATMAGASMLAIECQASRIEMRLATRYLDRRADTLDEALALIDDACATPRSRCPWGCSATRPRSCPSSCAAACGPTWSRTRRPRTISCTATCRQAGRSSAGATRSGIPRVMTSSLPRHAARSVCTSARCSRCTRGAFPPSTTATTSARSRSTKGVADAFAFPGFVPAYIRPLFCEGKGPFRWVALSGDPEDIRKTDARCARCFPTTRIYIRWLDMAGERIAFQGLPARICWLGLGQRHLAGLKFNEMVRSGELAAPIVIGRDHLDTGSVASPNRETEAMADGSDAVSDWPLLNALLNTAGGATWVSIHHGGGVGMGYSQHAGVVIVCDGTDAAAKRIERVLWNDPASGVMRHADAGYARAIEVARTSGLDLPMI